MNSVSSATSQRPASDFYAQQVKKPAANAPELPNEIESVQETAAEPIQTRMSEKAPVETKATEDKRYVQSAQENKPKNDPTSYAPHNRQPSPTKGSTVDVKV